MSGTRTVDVVITGRVQGVGYRVWAKHQAELHGLSGHVRNRDDGAVAATFSGPAEAVGAMLRACAQGPGGAAVTEVAVTERGEAGDLRGFAIRGA
ncbi:acylphosphatase [Methylobacterium planeticum]|uniref:acylphosphatase n=1 Tax=Methylobacterium planeticum TaxID=2615211 RepID=A0A6N6MX57_9HYPH|nr:acylphosphatase [Methylobacterium planeticum]KAB1076281.1 acylphosphatase [Methylobacterium planeticum]